MLPLERMHSSGDGMDANRCIAMLKNGVMLRLCSKGKIGKPTKYFIDDNELNLVCKRDGISSLITKKTHKKLSIQKIDEVRVGLETYIQQENLKDGIIDENDEDKSFALIFDRRRKTLNFLASTPQEQMVCVRALRQLLRNHYVPSNLNGKDAVMSSYNSWIRHYFRAADKNADSELSFDEIKSLLEHMHSSINPQFASELFHTCDADHDNSLSEDEFVEFYHKLTFRQELEDIIEQYGGSNDKKVLTATQLRRFLKESQFENFTLQQCKEFIQSFEVADENLKHGVLSVEGLRLFSLSNNFDIVDQNKENNVYQDMDHPLTDYFISTSHNTYLLQGQLMGDISTEAYISALERGCRCVEFDVHDGDDGEPRIYHQNTLTELNAILFKDALAAVQKHAFKRSHFPLILNIENHCSVPQQNRMAYWINHYFADNLADVSQFRRFETLPSPNALTNKIIIRARAQAKSGSNEISKDFTKLIHIITKSIDELDDLTSFSPYESTSVKETKAEKLQKSDPKKFIAATAKTLFRIYPGSFRTASTNYAPENFWITGCQLIALNFQSPTPEMRTYEGFFADNGRCGYILKQPILRFPSSFNPLDASGVITLKLYIRVISGQQLKPIFKDNAATEDSYSPAVQISTHGVERDCLKCCTQPIEGNILNPVWNEEFQFSLVYPELCVLRFVAAGKSHSFESNDILGSRCLPLNTLKKGYRSIGLLDIHGKPIPFSTLFVHIRGEILHCKDIDPLRIYSF